ncbi:cysteine rich repeat-containing protein [Methylocystis heyeri]|uniref:cysteine rich repeat-containing protein n=1 Tax=Methylocystis heyeri TaxID=391905 RepID=UPI00113B659D|nr:cysteine rich repeat-containing protein [Methylocystis heyeri]
MNVKNLALAIVSLAYFVSPAGAQEAREALIKYCKADVERLCAGVEPGGGRIIKCLKEHKEEMSVGCAEALMKIKSEMGK